MEDEEEDLPLLSHCCGTQLTDAAAEHGGQPNRSGSDSGALNAMPLLQTTPRYRSAASDRDTSARSPHGAVGLGLVSTPSRSAEETGVFLSSGPGLGARCLGVSEPAAAAPTAHEEEEEEEGRLEVEEEEEAVTSVEVQIGRKLRQIGDQFQQDHLQLLMQNQGGVLGGWWRLALTLCDLLFEREGAQR